MKFKQRMTYYLIAASVVLIISCICFVLTKSSESETPIDQMTGIILENKEYTLTQNELYEYEMDVSSYLNEGTISEQELKMGQISLGYINYMLGNYDDCVYFFKQAETIDYQLESTNELLLLNGLTKGYMAVGEYSLSNDYFLKTLELGKTLNDPNLMGELYLSYAKGLAKFNQGIDLAIEVITYSLEVNSTSESALDSMVYLVALYQAQGNFYQANNYSKQALDLATEKGLEEVKSRSFLLLANTYYMQGKYNQAMSLYQLLLEEEKQMSTLDRLEALGYLMQSCLMIADLSQIDQYLSEYFQLIEELDYFEQIVELNWIYALEAKINLYRNQSDDAIKSLMFSKKYYDENSVYMYANMEVWYELLELDIKALKEGVSDELVQSYLLLLAELDQRGIKNDLHNELVTHLIIACRQTNQLELAIQLMEEQLESIQENESMNYDSELDDVIEQYKGETITNEIVLLQRLILIGVIILTGSGLLIVITLRMNKKAKQLNDQLFEQSVTDYLTQVYNKRYLEEYLLNLQKEKQRVTCMLVDIDYFKKYNDTYGHIEGDHVLQKISSALNESFDTDFVARYGGEEFCVISQQPLDEFTEKVEQFYQKVKLLNLKHEASRVCKQVTVSSGIARTQLNEECDINKLIKCADLRLYEAKEQGRNRYINS